MVIWSCCEQLCCHSKSQFVNSSVAMVTGSVCEKPWLNGQFVNNSVTVVTWTVCVNSCVAMVTGSVCERVRG